MQQEVIEINLKVGMASGHKREITTFQNAMIVARLCLNYKQVSVNNAYV